MNPLKSILPFGNPAPPTSRRGYQAGNVTRLTNDWLGTTATADQDIYKALATVRGRARDLVQNNDYGRKYVRLCRVNIIGAYGFKFQAGVKEDDGTSDIQEIEKFRKHGQIGASQKTVR